MLKLKIFDCKTGQLQEHTFQPGTRKQKDWIIGRAGTCGLVLSSRAISRVHGRISYYQLVSNWLHDNITVGSQVRLCGGPMGKFTCANNNSSKLLMISAGIGVTPMLSMARWLYDTGSTRDAIFFYSVRTPRDIIMYQELQLLATRHPHFHLVITVTRPELGQPWWGFTGRLSDLMLKQIAPDLPDREVYVCGPEQFMSEAKRRSEVRNST